MNTRNGKIARLPRELREELNRRLADGEPGNRLVEWLNSLEGVQSVLTRDFGGRPVSEQNLSEWKQGGYTDWLKQQERRQLVRNWVEESDALTDETVGRSLSDRWSVVLLAELAQTAEELANESADAKERWAGLQEVLRRFAQLRREESNASRALVVRERWEREKAQADKLKRTIGPWMPRHALLLQELCLSGAMRQVGFGEDGAASADAGGNG